MAGDETHENFPWQYGVFDAHCHPTDTLSSLQSIPGMRAKVLTVMATRAQDQELVANAAEAYGVATEDADHVEMDWRSSKQHRIVPAFGWHPWFSHQMFDEREYDGAGMLAEDQKIAHYQEVLNPPSEDQGFLRSLPDPRPFGQFIAQTRDYLIRFPLALVGEIGLDKSFRIPESWLPERAEQRNDALTPGGREGRRLSPYRVSIEHQKKVLLAQLRLAGEMQRPVSVHGVQAHGIVYKTLAEAWSGYERRVMSKKERRKQESTTKLNVDAVDEDDDSTESLNPKPFPPRICLHSYSGSAENVKQYMARTVPCEVFFSFSTTINSWSEDADGKVEAAVREAPDENVLVESDLHTAGEDMDRYLESIVRKICEVKGWELEAGVQQLGRNWRRFVFGLR